MKNLEFKIKQLSKTKGTYGTLVIDAQITENTFNEHDTAALLFSIEFAVNGHSEVPMRNSYK